MSARRTKFYLDKKNGKFMGVCSGIADYTGIDVVWVRVAMVLSFFIVGWTLLGYFVIGFVADTKPNDLYSDRDDEKFWQGVRANPARSTRDVRSINSVQPSRFAPRQRPTVMQAPALARRTNAPSQPAPF